MCQYVPKKNYQPLNHVYSIKLFHHALIHSSPISCQNSGTFVVPSCMIYSRAYSCYLIVGLTKFYCSIIYYWLFSIINSWYINSKCNTIALDNLASHTLQWNFWIGKNFDLENNYLETWWFYGLSPTYKFPNLSPTSLVLCPLSMAPTSTSRASAIRLTIFSVLLIQFLVSVCIFVKLNVDSCQIQYIKIMHFRSPH